jgi:hypothetical protein
MNLAEQIATVIEIMGSDWKDGRSEFRCQKLNRDYVLR